MPRPLRAAKRIAPSLVFVIFAILTLTMVFKGLKNLKLDLSFPSALGIAVLVGATAVVVSIALVRRIPEDDAPVGETDMNPERAAHLARSLEKAVRHLRRVGSALPEPLTHAERLT